VFLKIARYFYLILIDFCPEFNIKFKKKSVQLESPWYKRTDRQDGATSHFPLFTWRRLRTQTCITPHVVSILHARVRSQRAAPATDRAATAIGN